MDPNRIRRDGSLNVENRLRSRIREWITPEFHSTVVESTYTIRWSIHINSIQSIPEHPSEFEFVDSWTIRRRHDFRTPQDIRFR